MAKDLRSFIRQYEEAHPEDVFRIEKPLKAEWECSAVAKKFDLQHQYPLIIYNQVVSAEGSVSPHAGIVNVVGDRQKLAFALDTTEDEVGPVWAERVKAGGIPPQLIDRRDAPCKENILKGDEINLLTMPALRIHEMDPGHYITAGLFTCHDPETWTVNAAYHRGFIAGPREIRCYLSSGTHAYLNWAAHRDKDQVMKVAYWIGHHPAVLMGAHTHQAYRESHYDSAGAVSGEPLRVVPSETLGDDFLVPADAEFVIEGIMRPGVVDNEGPFGEYPRYYGPQIMSPVMEVTCVTHRSGGIWDTHMVGMVHDYGAVQAEHFIYEIAKKAVPQVTAIHMPRSGNGRFHCYVQLRKTNDGQPKTVAMAILGAFYWVKHVVVVDEDIDIRDDAQVLWAIATRCQMDRDLFVVPGAFGSQLDPSATRDSISAKAAIDATMPALPQRYPLRTNVPADVMDGLKLEDVIPAERLRVRGVR